MVEKYVTEQLPALLQEDKDFEMPELDMTREGNLTKMAPFGTQMRMLTLRNRALIAREPQAGRAKIFNSIFTALLILIIYWKVGGPTPVDLTNFAG
jgi:hypothetical protein